MFYFNDAEIVSNISTFEKRSEIPDAEMRQLSQEAKCRLQLIYEDKVKIVSMEEWRNYPVQPQGGYKLLLAIPILGWIAYLVLWKLNVSTRNQAEAILGKSPNEILKFNLAIQAARIKWPYQILKAKACIEVGINEIDNKQHKAEYFEDALKILNSVEQVNHSAKLLVLRAFAKMQVSDLQDLGGAVVDCRTIPSQNMDKELEKLVKKIEKTCMTHLKEQHGENVALDISADIDPLDQIYSKLPPEDVTKIKKMDYKQLIVYYRELEILRAEKRYVPFSQDLFACRMKCAGLRIRELRETANK